MSAAQPPASPWARPQLVREGPVRTAGGLFRTAQGTTSTGISTGLGGAPLTATEDTVVAAVRLAYKVADAQIDRSTRLAQRLREAGDRAVGARSDRKALDATEQLVFRAMMGALSWLEGIADDGAPLKRLMSAEYRMVGSMLGLRSADHAARPDRRPPEEMPPAREPAAPDPPRPRVTVAHRDRHARYVRVLHLQVDQAAVRDQPLAFYSREQVGQPRIEGMITIAEGAARLVIDPPADARAGLWRAAICDEAGVQVGVVEIEL